MATRVCTGRTVLIVLGVAVIAAVPLVMSQLWNTADAVEYNSAVKQTPISTWAKAPHTSLASTTAAAAAKEANKLLVADSAANDKATKPTAVSQLTKDEVYLRRVYLDLIGHNPSPDQVTAFVLDPSADKRATLVDKLLADPRFGENWGRYWRDVIMYRRGDDRAQLASPSLYEFMTDQFNSNKPWDETVRSIITARGDVRENGATGLIMAQNGMTADITSEISRIFLGVQIQCANCHDHKTDRWKREQFHELAAFFPRISLRQVNTDDKRTFEVSSNNQPARPFANPKQANRPIGQPEHYMPDLKHPESKGTLEQPVFFLTGQKLDFGTPDAVRRETIAKWITAPTDEWFAKAFVNRVWGELVGEGFYDPIDDIGPDRTCSAPKTMDYLAHYFVDTGFDVKQLYRTIVATDAYQRDSRSRRNPDETPFAANCPERLRGDQLYDALVSALGMSEAPLRGGARGQAAGGGKGQFQRGPRNQFDQVFGYDPSTPRDEVTGSIPQALMLMNSPQVNRNINGNQRFTELGKLLASTSDDESVSTELYLRCLGREPNEAELSTCLKHVKASHTRATGFEDVLWALVNSTEFLYRK
ncbi:MAG TPA: DUF1549 domain-containing protein [Pirellulales bacterium]